jgi:hypothetical protein
MGMTVCARCYGDGFEMCRRCYGEYCIASISRNYLSFNKRKK